MKKRQKRIQLNHANKLKIAIFLMVAVLSGLMINLLSDSMWQLFHPDRTEQTESTQTEIELVYAYQNPQWNSAVEQMVSVFEKDNPDIKVNYEIHYEHKVYENVINKLIARDELGDIVQLKTPEVYAESGILGTIDTAVADLVDQKTMVGNSCYGVGAVNATTGILYNKELFERYDCKEPATYQEFISCCQILKGHGITPIGVAGGDLWHMEFWTNHFLRTDILAKDADWLKKCSAGTTKWTDSQVAAMFSDMQELFQSNYINEDWLTTQDGTLSYRMSQNEVAMIYTGAWTAAEILALQDDSNLGWFYLPDEEGNISVGESNDVFWSVSKACQKDQKKYEAAMRFLTFFYEEENYSQLCETVIGLPTTTQETTVDRIGAAKEIVTKYQSYPNHISSYVGDHTCPATFEQGYLVLMEDMLDGKNTVAQTQKYCQSLWENCIKEEAGSE